MRINKCNLQNFASYKELKFDFLNQGLTLINGPTGSGKSTFCDAAPWVLFGKTAKGGSVDSVLSWPGDRVTTGTLEIQLPNSTLTVYRSRGPRASDNDLYFNDKVRGKDLTDTQKLLNAHLGLDLSTYLSGAYIHEFSDISDFFITTPKNRRAICEQLVDLSLAKNLQASSSEAKKQTKNFLAIAENSLSKLGARLEMLNINLSKGLELMENFDSNKDKNLAILMIKYDKYEDNRAQTITMLKQKNQGYLTDLEALPPTDEPCPHCGAKKNDTVSAVLLEKIKHLKNELKKWEINENPHLSSIEREQAQVNDYAVQLEDIKFDILTRTRQLNEAKTNVFDYKQKIDDLETLEQLLTAFRSITITNAIKSLETRTNSLLQTHFDAEIQVNFNITEDIDVSIKKDGNDCVYSQLSKGQRQLLKLCFAVSAMRQVSDNKGVKFPQIFLDEAFDGLSDTMKKKAFGLLQTLELEYESIFVVDHSTELKALFDKQYTVELINGNSVLAEG